MLFQICLLNKTNILFSTSPASNQKGGQILFYGFKLAMVLLAVSSRFTPSWQKREAHGMFPPPKPFPSTMRVSLDKRTFRRRKKGL